METFTFTLKLKKQKGAILWSMWKKIGTLRISNVKIDIIISQYCKCNVTMQDHHYTGPYPAVFFSLFIVVLFSLLFPFYFLFIVYHSGSVSITEMYPEMRRNSVDLNVTLFFFLSEFSIVSFDFLDIKK